MCEMCILIEDKLQIFGARLLHGKCCESLLKAHWQISEKYEHFATRLGKISNQRHKIKNKIKTNSNCNSLQNNKYIILRPIFTTTFINRIYFVGVQLISDKTKSALMTPCVVQWLMDHFKTAKEDFQLFPLRYPLQAPAYLHFIFTIYKTTFVSICFEHFL